MFGIQRPAQLVCVGYHRCYFCSECCISGKSMVARRVNRLLALPMNAGHDAGQAATAVFQDFGMTPRGSEPIACQLWWGVLNHLYHSFSHYPKFMTIDKDRNKDRCKYRQHCVVWICDPEAIKLTQNCICLPIRVSFSFFRLCHM